MTRTRIYALNWFHERGEVSWFDRSAPTDRMRNMMIRDEQLSEIRTTAKFGMIKFSLTDKGRRDLHEATR